MPAPTSGLARVTIRAPRRRLDLAIPHQVPLAELLPEVLRRAGEVGDQEGQPAGATGGWILRRGDGASLAGGVALAHQGVRDGDVLYLVPRNLTWPEPDHDDVVEQIAAGARQHGRVWDAATARWCSMVAAGLVALTGLMVLVAAGPAGSPSLPGQSGAPGAVAGLAAIVVAIVLLAAGGLFSRALGDATVGTVAAGFALPYAAIGGAFALAGDRPGWDLAQGQVLVGAALLLLASVVGAVAVGHGLWLFTAGATVGGFAGVGACLGLVLTGPGAVAVVLVALVGGIGLAPSLAVRLGRLPLPEVSAAPEALAALRLPQPPEVLAAVIRADQILSGSLLGLSVLGLGAVAVLARSGGVAGSLLAGLASAALLLRARLFPSLAARLPLLAGGMLGLAVTLVVALDPAGLPLRLAAFAVAATFVVVLLTSAAVAARRRAGGSGYLSRLADIVDIATIVALAPTAAAVLGLYALVRGLAS